MRKVLCLVLAAAGILAACSKVRPVHQMGEMGADTLNALGRPAEAYDYMRS